MEQTTIYGVGNTVWEVVGGRKFGEMVELYITADYIVNVGDKGLLGC